MRKKRIFLTLAGLLFLLLIGTEVTINKKIENSIGQFLYVFSFASGEKSFSKNQEEMLKNTEYDTCFLTETEMTVKSFRSVGTMQIIGANENFQHLSNKQIVSGAWFNALQVERKNKVVVLSEAAALQYFGTTNIVSNKLEIDGLKYEIIGVMKEEGSNIYIPIDNIVAYHKPNAEYSQLWCNLQNEAELSLFIQKLGVEDSEINIFRGGEYQRIVNLRTKIILGIIGILLSIEMLKRIRKNMKEMMLEIKILLKKEYLVECRKLLKQRKSMENLICMVFYGGGIIYSWRIICFDFILPDVRNVEMKVGILGRISHVLDFYMSPHIWVNSFKDIDDLNLISIVVFFLTVLVGCFIVQINICMTNKEVSAVIVKE